MSLDRDLLEEYQTRYDQTLGKKHFIIKRVMKKSISDEVVNAILSDWARVHICSFSDGIHRIMVEGELFVFDMSDRFGPLFLGKKGEPLKSQPRPRHKVWEAVSLWSQQGKNVGEDGICIWKPESDPREGMINIYGRTWVSPEIYERFKSKLQGGG